MPLDDYFNALLSNGDMQYLFFYRAQNGYYRASRFDRSGIVGCGSYSGHTFFGEWSHNYDPLANNSITGPVEEFHSDDGGALGCNEVRPRGLFVRLGFGVFRKIETFL
ncbi:hypothetical protein [Granulicella arctica]|uniref:Uncharacterized protein n=1 Tax=Granulicella arctica TaxID=940613 RepID=A0A7Y9PGT3_9BACT|nr:hypothetical protein [Granulicella arctica]NYF79625.1 hypothetical protein [Granulicella arctica]